MFNGEETQRAGDPIPAGGSGVGLMTTGFLQRLTDWGNLPEEARNS